MEIASITIVRITLSVIQLARFANAEIYNANNSKIVIRIRKLANVELYLVVEKRLLAVLMMVFAYVTLKHALIQKLVT